MQQLEVERELVSREHEVETQKLEKGVGWTLRAGGPAPVPSCSSILSVGSGRHSVSLQKTNEPTTHLFFA